MDPFRLVAALGRRLADAFGPPKVPAGPRPRRWPEAEDLPKRRRTRRDDPRDDRPDDGGGAGVREPRRPRPPGPVSAAAAAPEPEPALELRLPDARI